MQGRPDEVPKADEPQKPVQTSPKAEPKKAEEEKKTEAVKAEAEKPSASEGKKEDSKVAESAKKGATPAKSPPAGPLQPGAQPKGKSVPKPAAKTSAKATGAPKKKPQQPGPPQQPGLITPEAQAVPKKAAKGEKGKGGGKKGSPSGIQLCVRNLVKDATTEQLQGLFQPFGELIGVDVKKNTDGTCRGYGFVTYASMADANKAISAMNNKQVEGKSLIVVLSDRQQGTTKAEREAQTTGGKGGGKGKDGKEGKGADKGKGKAKQPANIATTLPASTPPAWPYQSEGTYPYGYGYPMVSPMAAYANQGMQGYPNTQHAALQAMQAQFITQAQQALQMQAFQSALAGRDECRDMTLRSSCRYCTFLWSQGSLTGLNPGLNANMNPNMNAGSLAPQAPAPAPVAVAASCLLRPFR